MKGRGVRYQEEARARSTAMEANRAGLSLDEYRAAVFAAFVVWSSRWPWRWLPDVVGPFNLQPWRVWLFTVCGRRTAARFIAGWKESAGG